MKNLKQPRYNSVVDKSILNSRALLGETPRAPPIHRALYIRVFRGMKGSERGRVALKTIERNDPLTAHVEEITDAGENAEHVPGVTFVPSALCAADFCEVQPSVVALVHGRSIV